MPRRGFRLSEIRPAADICGGANASVPKPERLCNSVCGYERPSSASAGAAQALSCVRFLRRKRFRAGLFRMRFLRRRTFRAGLFRVWFLRRRTFCAGAFFAYGFSDGGRFVRGLFPRMVSPAEDVSRGAFSACGFSDGMPIRSRASRIGAAPSVDSACGTDGRKGCPMTYGQPFFRESFRICNFRRIEKLVGQPFFCGRRAVNRQSGSAFRATIPERP